MAFTRKFLKSLSLTDEQIEAVIEAHTEVTDAQKATIADLTAKAEKADDLQKQVEKLSSDDWEGKYNAKDKELQDYKAAVASKEQEAAVKAAYRELLVAEHVGDRQLDAVIRATDFKGMKLGADGKLENADTLKENIKKEWSGFITTESQKGANVPTPPLNPNAGGANSRAAELAKRFHEQRYGKAPQQTNTQET